jgi:hypothetical protein
MNNSSHDWDTKYHDATAKVYVLEKERRKKEKKRNKPLKFSSTILFLNFEGELHIL